MTTEAQALRPKSFRDPAGAVFRCQGRILRSVHPAFLPQLEAFLATRAAHSAFESGRLPATTRLSGGAGELLCLSKALAGEAGTALAGEAVFEHERIPFANYPYEWPAEMLHAAAVLTLDLAVVALEEGFGIKDATPYNVLFRGATPVFVDVLSFEKREERDAVWMAYAQFVRTFLLPLAAYRYFGMAPGEVLGTRRDGLDPDTVYAWLSWRRRLTPPMLGLVSLPHWLKPREQSPDGEAARYHPTPAASQDQARFILHGLLQSCRRQLRALAPTGRKESTWSDYLDHKSLYTPQSREQKEAFVRGAVESVKARRVLDVGANEGHYSFLAARAGASVVAIDSDPAVVGTIWRRASAEGLDVLPLVVDLARPTPSTGWRNQECESFLTRAAGHFDMVILVAVLHHLLVTERIPLAGIVSLASELTSDYAVIEFVAPQDPMFQRIVRGREHLHSGLTVEFFEQAARTKFDILRSEKINGLNRWLYLLRKRD